MKFAPLYEKEANAKIKSYFFPNTILEKTSCPNQFYDQKLPHLETFSSVESQLLYLSKFLTDTFLQYTYNNEKSFISTMHKRASSIFKGLKLSFQNFFVIYYLISLFFYCLKSFMICF